MPRGTINGEPYEVPEGWAVVSDHERELGQAALAILSDLTRSPNGRHRGDAEYQDPSGVSQGNPFLKVGQRIGTTIYGAPICVPENPGDPKAWRGWLSMRVRARVTTRTARR